MSDFHKVHDCTLVPAKRLPFFGWLLGTLQGAPSAKVGAGAIHFFFKFQIYIPNIPVSPKMSFSIDKGRLGLVSSRVWGRLSALARGSLPLRYWLGVSSLPSTSSHRKDPALSFCSLFTAGKSMDAANIGLLSSCCLRLFPSCTYRLACAVRGGYGRYWANFGGSGITGPFFCRI